MHSGPVAFSAAEVSEFGPLLVDIVNKVKSPKDAQMQLGREKYSRFSVYYKQTIAEEKARRGLPSASSRSSTVVSSPASSSSSPVAEQSVPAEVELTDREKVIFSQIASKIDSDEWNFKTAAEYFRTAGVPGYMSKFNRYYEQETRRAIAEQELRAVALKEHKAMLVRGVEENNRAIEEARMQASQKITARASAVKVGPT